MSDDTKSEKERYWPDLTAYGLSLWLSREEGHDDPPRYRFRILAQDDLSPEQVLRARAPLAALAEQVGGSLPSENATARGAVRLEWTGLHVPLSAVFLETFSYARIRPVASLAVGPWMRDAVLIDGGLPLAQWFWRAADPDPDRMAAAPGHVESHPYALWSPTPEGAAAYGRPGEPVTRTDYQERGGSAFLGREPRNGGFWMIPREDRALLAPGDDSVRPTVAAETRGAERADAGEKMGGARKDRAAARAAREAATEEAEGIVGAEWEDRSWLALESLDALRKVAASLRRDTLWKPPADDEASTFLEGGGTVAAWYFRELIRKNVAPSPLTQGVTAPFWKKRSRFSSPRRIAAVKGGLMIYPLMVHRLQERVRTWRTMDDVLRDIQPGDSLQDIRITGSPDEIGRMIDEMPVAVLARVLSGKKRWLAEDVKATDTLTGDRVAALVADAPARVQPLIEGMARLWQRSDADFTLADAVTAVTPQIQNFATWGWGKASENLWHLAFKLAVVERVMGDVEMPYASRLALADALLTAGRPQKRPHTDPVEGTGIPRREIPSPRFQNLKREGPVRRAGSITEEILLSTFGLRAVEYGNWVKGADRQALLDGSYDALFDMAMALAVPTEFMGFHGRLGLALGARGLGGSAAAHYEPGRRVINLTKTLGSGTLAHEWSHALDHWLGELCGAPLYATEPCAVQPLSWAHDEAPPRASLGHFFQTITNYGAADALSESARQRRQRALDGLITHLAAQPDRDAAQTAARQAVIRWIREDVAAQVAEAGHPGLAATVLAQSFCRPGRRWTFSPDVIARHVTQFAESAGTDALDAEALRAVTWQSSFSAFRAAYKALGRRVAQTDFVADAQALGKYWSTPRELFARAFSAVIHDRMAERGIINDFASRYSAPRIFLEARYKASPNPEGAERARFLQEAVPMIAMIQQEAAQARMAVVETRSIPAQAAALGAAP